MTAEHTPGPWEVMRKITETESGLEVIPIYGPPEGRQRDRRVVGTASFHDPVAEANARLIAAAPELLAMLELIVAQGGSELTRYPTGFVPEFKAARRLIAKAAQE